MSGLVVYLLGIVAATTLLALAVSVYVDGVGYLVLHVMALAGVGAYVFAIASGEYGLPPLLAGGAAVVIGAVAGLASAEILRLLRGDELTLLSFGLGVCGFEAFRISHTTGGVFGIAAVPGLLPSSLGGEAVAAAAMLLIGLVLALTWRRSVTGRIAIAIRLDEQGAVSIGARLKGHQRLTGVLAGILAALSGVQIAATTHFIEPRQFQPSGVLVALAGVVVAQGQTPLGVAAAAVLIVVSSQGARLISESAVLAGPVTEIVIASLLGLLLTTTRVRAPRT